MQHVKTFVPRRPLLALVAVTLAALGGAGTANAASFTVTKTTDSSDGACTAALCSLRDAVVAADKAGGSSTITLPAGSYKLTIPTSGTPFDPSRGDLDIDNGAKVTINGAGRTSTTVDADDNDRAFTVQAGAGLSLAGLTIANGQPQTDVGIGCGICGGGIWNQGALALSGVTITASNGNDAGGAIYSRAGSTVSVTDSAFTFDSSELGGAILTSAKSTRIAGSTFSANVAFRQGGAIQTQAGAVNINSSTFSGNVSGSSAGAIEELSNSKMTVDDSSFVNNSSTSVAGAIDDVDTPTTSVTNSRFVGNTAESSGALDVLAAGGKVTLSGDEFDDNNAAVNAVGAVFQIDSFTVSNSSFVGNHGGFGAVFQLSNGAISMTNVTMTHNSSSGIGGALLFNAAEPLPVSLTNVTIADNSAAPGGGGGITDASQMMTGSGATGVHNTIIADNTGGDCGVWSPGSRRVPAAVDAGFNLDSDGTCFKGDAKTDKVGVDPLLGAPADNGGSVLTDALMPGSPAIDGGSNTGCPATDARGITRPQGASCDIGAYEFAAAGLALSKSAPATATTGVPFTYTLKTTNNGPGPSTATTVVDQLPANSTLFGATASKGSCSASGAPAKVTCSLGLLATGASATVTIVAAVSQPGTATNTASATNGEGASANASATTVVKAPVAPAGAGAPTATTGAATAIGKHGGTLNGQINSGGQPTAYFFKYGKKRPLGNITAVQHVASNASVSAAISHLSPGTRYRYRLLAVNDSGSSLGTVHSFKTAGHKARGALRLDGTKLKVKHRKVSATFTCASAKACRGSFSIVVRLGSKKAVLAKGRFGQIRAHKRRTVEVTARPDGLAVLAKAPRHRAAGKLTARSRTGQRGLSRAVIVILT